MIFQNRVLVNIEPTPNCPARCAMCPRHLVRDDGFMALETLERIILAIDPSFVWEVDLGGRGEPTIHPKFHQFGGIMKKSGVTTAVVTTAVTCTPKNVKSMAEDYDVIRLSVSSIEKESFEKVHIGLNHKNIWNNIENLAEAAADKITIHLVGGPDIYDSLPRTVEHLRKLGLKSMRLFPLWNRGGSLDVKQDKERRIQLMRDLAIPSSESEYSSGMGKVKHYVNAIAGKLYNNKYCFVGNGGLSISYDGKILGCHMDFGHSSIIGSIEENLKEVLKNRVAMLGRMKVCEGCNAHKVAIFS